MNDLIERLEKATGPSRALDADLAMAFGQKVFQTKRRDGQGSWLTYSFRNGDEVPHYTASIDAALTLVPAGFRWKLGYSRHVRCNAELIDYRIQMEPNLGRFDGECDSNHAIAICIAARKARALLLPNESKVP